MTFAQASSRYTFDLSSTPIPHIPTPYLMEIWNWQGDTSILPFKFESILNACSSVPEKYSHTALKKTYIDDKGFDPMGFHFLTSRSTAIGLCFVLPGSSPSECRVVYCACVPKHRHNQVEECLLALTLGYCKGKGYTKVIVDTPPEDLEGAYADGVF